MEQMPIELEIGWQDMDAGVSRLKRILHGVDGASFSSEEYIHLYTYVSILFFLLHLFGIDQIRSDLIALWQNDIQHVHAETAARLLEAAL
jgi:hypothetical protein